MKAEADRLLLKLQKTTDRKINQHVYELYNLTDLPLGSM